MDRNSSCAAQKRASDGQQAASMSTTTGRRSHAGEDVAHVANRREPGAEQVADERQALLLGDLTARQRA